MKKLLCLLTTSVFVLIIVWGHAQNTDKQFIEGEILVQLDNPSAIEKLISDYKSFDLKQKHIVSQRFNIYLIQFDNKRATNQSLIHSIKADANVLNVQNNHQISLRNSDELIPNDSLFGLQWALENTGQNGGESGADVNATEAWDITTGGLTADGDTIVVAIIDGGSDIYHEDLDFWVNYQEIPGNNIDDDENGYIDDRHGWNAYNHNGDIPLHQHGTHVAGIAGAKGNNTLGVTGVNWNVKILPIAGSSSQESTVVEALSYVYVVRERYDQTNGQEGAFIVVDNCSFGVNEGQPEDYPIWEAMYDSLGTLGILSIGATANKNWDIDEVGDIPTAFETSYMIAVTNTTNEDQKNTGAAYGQTTIDLGAPGTIILSTLINNQYNNKTGTSMATPHVAGAVALLMSAADSTFIADYKNNPGESILKIRNYILDGVDELEDLTGKTVTGGRLNLYNSLNLLLDAPGMTTDKDAVYIELLVETEGFENLNISNTGSDTIYYTIGVEENPSWLDLSQYEGTLLSQEWDEIFLTFDALGLDTGSYHTTLEISAENMSTIYIPVTMLVFDDVGINEQLTRSPLINVFPNPFSSELNVSILNANVDFFDIEIYSQSGEKVFTGIIKAGQKSVTLNWKASASGVYYYTIKQNNKAISSGKLIRL